MKKTLFSIFIISVLIVPISVHAGELDGKGLLCPGGNGPPVGYVFNNGQVSKWMITGYKKRKGYSVRFHFEGTRYIVWNYIVVSYKLDRQLLRLNGTKCEASSKEEIFRTFDRVINEAKKKNKF